MGDLQGTMVRAQEVSAAAPALTEFAIYRRSPKLHSENTKASDLGLKFYGIAKVRPKK